LNPVSEISTEPGKFAPELYPDDALGEELRVISAKDNPPKTRFAFTTSPNDSTVTLYRKYQFVPGQENENQKPVDFFATSSLTKSMNKAEFTGTVTLQPPLLFESTNKLKENNPKLNK
ncbi:MAG: hypothetical protein JWO53_877, partial [Chlamydiia bacterium]|nr:hypothetical protein [Chlamydiia bacterium]